MAAVLTLDPGKTIEEIAAIHKTGGVRRVLSLIIDPQSFLPEHHPPDARKRLNGLHVPPHRLIVFEQHSVLEGSDDGRGGGPGEGPGFDLFHIHIKSDAASRQDEDRRSPYGQHRPLLVNGMGQSQGIPGNSGPGRPSGPSHVK